MAVQRILKVIKITIKSMDHLTTTTITEATEGMLSSLPLPRRNRENSVVADSRAVVGLWPHKTSTPKQRPSPMMRVVHRKDQTCTHATEDWIQFTNDQHRPHPARSDETHLHAPSDDARCIIVGGSNMGGIISTEGITTATQSHPRR